MDGGDVTLCDAVKRLLDRMRDDPYWVHDNLGFAAMGAETALGLQGEIRDAFRHAKGDLLERLYIADRTIRGALQEVARTFGCGEQP